MKGHGPRSGGQRAPRGACRGAIYLYIYAKRSAPPRLPPAHPTPPRTRRRRLPQEGAAAPGWCRHPGVLIHQRLVGGQLGVHVALVEVLREAVRRRHSVGCSRQQRQERRTVDGWTAAAAAAQCSSPRAAGAAWGEQMAAAAKAPASPARRRGPAHGAVCLGQHPEAAARGLPARLAAILRLQREACAGQTRGGGRREGRRACR